MDIGIRGLNLKSDGEKKLNKFFRVFITGKSEIFIPVHKDISKDVSSREELVFSEGFCEPIEDFSHFVFCR